MLVSERALTLRINRKLKRDHRKLCKSRRREQSNLGDFHVVDAYRNMVVDHHVDIEALGRELGVLAEAEKIAA
jgi:hypothetical protein